MTRLSRAYRARALHPRPESPSLPPLRAWCKACRASTARRSATRPPFRAAPIGAMCVMARAFAPRRRWMPSARHADLAATAGASGCGLQSRAVSPRHFWKPRRTPAWPRSNRTSAIAGSMRRSADARKLILARIEDAPLEPEPFRHRPFLPHDRASRRSLRGLPDHARVLKPGGLLVLDAPNIALIGGDDILEEWFIDKHLYHFSARTLMRMIDAAGFRDHRRTRSSRIAINLLLVARKADTAYRTVAGRSPRSGATPSGLCRTMPPRARAISPPSPSSPRKSPAWRPSASRCGARAACSIRWSSTAVSTPTDLSLLIDTHLTAHVNERHGCRLTGPEALAEADPDVDRRDVARICRRDRTRGQAARAARRDRSSTPIFWPARACKKAA